MMNDKWELEKLQSYLDNQVEENINLDYKAADALRKDGKKKDISKDVSAMANSAGGIIIYGIKEFDDITRRHLPEKLDPINRKEISKEWLEQVINTNIQPKITGIEITPVSIDSHSQTVIYVVEIPQSSTAHQANDKKYYKRYNFESVAMEDYEIRDIMSRLKHPDLTLALTIQRKQEQERDFITGGSKIQYSLQNNIEPLKWFEYELKVAIHNTGKIFANYVNYYLEIPEEILREEVYLKKSNNRQGYMQFYGVNIIRDVVDVKPNIGGYTKKYGPSRYDPVLPSMMSRTETIQLKDDLDYWEKELFWEIYADNAEVKNGRISLSELRTDLIDVWE